AVGPRDERAAERGGGQRHRPRLGARRPRRGRDARRDPGRPPATRRQHHARCVLRSRRGADALVTPAFLSPSRCDEGTLASPLRRALEGADADAVRDVSLEGVVEIRGDVDSVLATTGEELVRLSHRRAFLFTYGDPAEVVDRARAAGALAS